MNFDSLTWIGHLRERLTGNQFWSEKLRGENVGLFTLHLAILREPYLQFVLEGKKTIETRFAKMACPPFERVAKGDVIMLKRTPGDIVGVCAVDSAWFYRLDAASLAQIKSKFGRAICPAGPDFWDERRQATVASLILIDKVTKITPLKIEKRDRRGWVVFHRTNAPLLPRL